MHLNYCWNLGLSQTEIRVSIISLLQCLFDHLIAMLWMARDHMLTLRKYPSSQKNTTHYKLSSCGQFYVVWLGMFHHWGDESKRIIAVRLIRSCNPNRAFITPRSLLLLFILDSTVKCKKCHFFNPSYMMVWYVSLLPSTGAHVPLESVDRHLCKCLPTMVHRCVWEITRYELSKISTAWTVCRHRLMNVCFSQVHAIQV